MSGLLNSSINASTSNISESAARSFPAFSAQSGGASPAFHHTGTIQGLHNTYGSYNVPNMTGTLASRNSAASNVPSGGLQQPSGSYAGGRFAPNNLPLGLSQISHGNVHGHPGVANRGLNVVGNPIYGNNTTGIGGSVPGILPNSSVGNRSAVPGLGVSTILGSSGHRITNSVGNMLTGGNLGRNLNTGGGLSTSGLTARLNLTSNAGSANLNLQGSNRLINGVLQQASPQVISMLGNSYLSGGPLSQSHAQTINNLNSLGMLNDFNSNDNSPFDINDFPQLTSRPSSAGGPQGQLGTLRKQGLGVSPIVQQSQEFSIQNEDFPALPGFKGTNADYGMDLHQKQQLQESTVFPVHMGRSAGFNLGAYSSHRPQHQQQHGRADGGNASSYSSISNQDLLFHGADVFRSSHPTYHPQTSGPPGIGLRSFNSGNPASGIGSYDHLIQQYQQQQNQSQYRLQQISPAITQPQHRDQTSKAIPHSPQPPDPFGLLGLLSVIRTSDADLKSLALGIDLTTLGLNLNSTEDLHKTFASPWSDEPAKGVSEFVVPQCYHTKPPPVLHHGYFSKFRVETLFYIFYSMPGDEAQLYAANELYNRGWFYHTEHRVWLVKVSNTELAKQNTYERGSYLCFDPNTWETIRKDNFVVHYEMVEKRPALPQH